MNVFLNLICKQVVLSAVLLFCGFVTVEAQTIEGWDSQENIHSNNIRTFDERYEGVEGTPFLFEDWYSGEIELKNGRKVMVELLNFDIYRQEVVIEKENGMRVAPVVGNIESFKIRKSELDSARFEKGPDGFRQVLYDDGKNRLFKEYSKEFVKADYKGAYSSNRTSDKFVSSERYIIETPEGSNTVKKVSKRNIKRLFKGMSFEPIAVLKKNNLSVSEAGLVKLMESYSENTK